jgi:hypothetical protein
MNRMTARAPLVGILGVVATGALAAVPTALTIVFALNAQRTAADAVTYRDLTAILTGQGVDVHDRLREVADQ